MSAREYLWIVKESALGTVMSSPTAGTDSIYIRLIDGNAFSMVAEPIIEDIPYGGGFAVQAEAVSDHYSCTGSLKTKLYPSQAPLLLAWGISRINSAQTTPWTTTEPAGDLASCSVYHAVRRSDGTYSLKRFAGCKVKGLRVEVSRQSTTAMLSLDLQASRAYGCAADTTSDPTSGEFAAPTEAQYPTAPFTFAQTAGTVTVGSTRTQYDSLAIAVQNALDGRWFETSYLSINQFNGRASTLDTDLYLKASPDDRSAFEAITAQTCSVEFNNGTNTTTFQFNGKNHITKLPYDLPLDKAFMTKLSLKNRWDPTALSGVGQDLSVAFT